MILALGIAAGVLALSYEVLWTRELLTLLGSTTRVSALVLSAFMAGLALGGYAVGRWTMRCGRPLLLYAAAEAAVGGVGLALPYVLHTGTRSLANQALLDAALLGVLLVPAFLMGAGLPALAAALQQRGASHLKYVAWLYGLNTLGGAIAALGTGLLALPLLGLTLSERGVAYAGLAVAAFATALGVRSKEVPPLPERAPEQPSPSSDLRSGTVPAVAVISALLLSGVAALGYEVLWTRTLVLIVGSSSTAFAVMLGLYLFGMALGGFAISWVPWSWTRPARALQFLQLGVGIAAIGGAAAFAWLPSAALFGFAHLGTSPWSILAVDSLVVAAIILPPTVFIGASFPVAVRLLGHEKPRRGLEVGIVLAVTTTGNVAGILLTAFALIPAVGLQRGIAVLALFNAGAAFLIWFAAQPRGEMLRYGVPAAASGVVMAGLLLPPWDVVVMTSGVFRQAPAYLALLGGASGLERAVSAYQIRFYREGQEAVVAVFDRPTLQDNPHRVLTIDGKVDASTGADMATQVLSGHLPFAFKPEAKDALVIGLASGVTVGALVSHPLENIDVVEIEPAVIKASRAFDTFSGAPLGDPRVRLTVDDGRRYLSRTRRSFDIVVSEPSNPWLTMSARLFTREFFALVGERLNPDGVLVQWIPLYGLSPSQFQALLRTLLDVFPEVALFRVAEGDLVAVAAKNPLSLRPRSVYRLFEGEARRQLQRIDVREPAQLLARWIADGDGLRAALGPGPLNTDDNGLLEFGSPWYLLSDTRPANESITVKAAHRSGIAERLVTRLLGAGRHEALDGLALRYLEEGRLDLLHALASALRSAGEPARADLYAGNALAAQGRWSEALEFWERHESPRFWRRRARAAFMTGSPQAAVRLFALVPRAERRNEDLILHALALAQLGRAHDALRLLETEPPSAKPISVPALVTPFLRFALLSELGTRGSADAELKRFEHGLDALRRCLELEGCQRVADGLIKWSDGTLRGLDARYSELLREAVYLRISRPLPHYFEAVRRLWLGEENAAARSLRIYLDVLPEPDPLSRAHSLLSDAKTSIPFNGEKPLPQVSGNASARRDGSTPERVRSHRPHRRTTHNPITPSPHAGT